MRKNLVGLIWLAGLMLAGVVYLVGPDRILYAAIAAIDHAGALLNGIVAAFAINTYEVMRALALGLAPAFVVLCLVAQRRGIHYLRPLIVVGVLFLGLLYEPAHDGWGISSTRWTVAFVAVAVGCAVMSRRLTFPEARDLRARVRMPGA